MWSNVAYPSPKPLGCCGKRERHFSAKTDEKLKKVFISGIGFKFADAVFPKTKIS